MLLQTPPSRVSSSSPTTRRTTGRWVVAAGQGVATQASVLFLTLTSLFWGIMATQFTLHPGATRCAVVIGVDNPGGTDLAPLTSAASGAEEVAIWLDQEGYDVKLYTDQNGAKVLPADINAGITAFVDSQTYELMVLYFSGHGYFKNLTDYWVLTGAPEDSNAAIVLFEAAERAKSSGFTNIVIVSDACRSKPTGLATDIRGSAIFPNRAVLPAQRGIVDQIMSTAPDTVAFEADLLGTGKRVSVLTYCLRLAFERPVAAMISDVTINGATVKVVTNRTLRKVIPKAVQEALKAARVKGTQWPELIIPSDDDVFIARAKLKPPAAHPANAAGSESTAFFVDAASVMNDSAAAALKLNRLAQRLSAADLTVPGVERFETHTGIAVIGAKVRDAVAERGARIEMYENDTNGKQSSVLRCFPAGGGAWSDAGGHSVAVRFDSGRGAIIAALYGYVAHVTVGIRGIVNIRYVPSSNSSRYSNFMMNKALIDKWHAQAASMARDSVLNLQGWPDAVAAAEEVRVWKALDPSLGVYASYFYESAGPQYYGNVAEVMSIMAGDNQIALFDPALLGEKLGTNGRTTVSTGVDRIFPVCPMCPMLTQGWHYLRPRGIRLPEVLDDGQDELEPTLWTTFKASRMEKIFKKFNSADLQ